MLRNMAGSLLRHETIHTTLPKAKELRRVVEPLITLGKNDSEANRRLAFSRLRDTEVVSKLFVDLGPRFRTRPGGYTRILRMVPRAGRCRAHGADAAGRPAGPGGRARARCRRRQAKAWRQACAVKVGGCQTRRWRGGQGEAHQGKAEKPAKAEAVKAAAEKPARGAKKSDDKKSDGKKAKSHQEVMPP